MTQKTWGDIARDKSGHDENLADWFYLCDVCHHPQTGQPHIVCGECANGECKCGIPPGTATTLVLCEVCGRGHRYSRCCSEVCAACLERIKERRN